MKPDQTCEAKGSAVPSLVPVLLGAEAGERLRLDLLLPADGEGWIRTRIEVRNGSFYGSFETSLRDDELIAFRRELRALYETLTGSARLEAVEGCLSLDVAAGKSGGIDVKGYAADKPGVERQLRFGFAIDQSFLPKVLDALDELSAVDRASPLSGRRARRHGSLDRSQALG